MKKKIIITISWLFVVIWMAIIFMFSNQNAKESVGGSRKIIKDAIETTVETSEKIGIIKEKPSEKKITTVSKGLDFPFRKTLHMMEYLILMFLVLNALYQSGIRNKKLYIIGLIICFIYACTDEFHQSFLDRTSKFTDVLIDTTGGLVGLLLYNRGLYIFNRKKK
jgi:VanZ family protein